MPTNWTREREAALEWRMDSWKRDAQVMSLSALTMLETDLPDLLAHTRKQSEVIRGLVEALERVHGLSDPDEYDDAGFLLGKIENVSREALAAARELETA